MKTGLVLEGGAMRGLFTAGVMDAFMMNGIEFDGGIGVSAGAAFGCNYKSRQIGRVIRYNQKFCLTPEFCSFRSLLKTGDLFGAQFCYYDIPERLDPLDEKAYLANPMRFFAVATDIETGLPAYRELAQMDHDDVEFMRASASMPVASRPVEVDGHLYLDGGISDPIPLKAFEEMGYEKNCVILTQPRDYVKKPQSMMPLFSKALRKYPAVIEGMDRRHVVYNDETVYVKQREEEGYAYVVAPPEALPIGRIEHNASVIRDVYDIGYRCGMSHVESLKQFLAK